MSPSPPGDLSLRGWRHAVLVGIWIGIALLSLTPFVVTQSTAFPFVVGKAVYSRTLIEVVFALWAVLALHAPAYRPRWSWLLALLGLGLATSLLSAAFGASFSRSLWSTYERMQGIVDHAHWVALAIVLVSVLRTAGSWRAMFSVHLAASIALTVLATLRYVDMDVSYISNIEDRTSRAEVTFGNSIYFGAYAMINCIIAAGLAIWSFTPNALDPAKRLPARAFWLLASAANLWSLTLSGSLTSAAGLLAGLGFLALAYVLFGQARIARYAAGGVLGLLGAAAIGLASIFFAGGVKESYANPMLERLATASVEGETTRMRLSAWRAGYEGFLARPVLGWGPENYIVPFGRFATGLGTTMVVHDNAHNEVVEQAATKGTVGLAVYVAYWLLAIGILLRAVRIAKERPNAAGEQMPGLFVAAALIGDLVTRQALFPASVVWLQHILLISFAAHLETTDKTSPPVGRLGLAGAAALGRGSVRAALAGLALAVAAAGAWANQAAFAGGQALLRQVSTGDFRAVAEAVETFPPLANTPRVILLLALADNWEALRVNNPAGAAGMLAYADSQAAMAVGTEPENWQIHVAAARLYNAAAATEPDIRAAAEHFTARSLELAPERAPLELAQ